MDEGSKRNTAEFVPLPIMLVGFAACFFMTLMEVSVSTPIAISGLISSIVCWALLLVLTKHAPNRFGLFLFGLSLLLSMLLAAAFSNPPVSDFLYQYETAQSLASGGGHTAFHSEYFAKYPWQVGWSLVESVILAICPRIAAIKVFQSLCSAALVTLVYKLVSENTSETVAKTTGLALAVFPSICVFCGMLTNQILSALLCVVALYVLIGKGIPFRSAARAIASGAFLALAYFIRPDAILALGAFAIGMVICLRKPLVLKSVIEQIKTVLLIILSFVVLTWSVSAVLLVSGLTVQQDAEKDSLFKVVLGTYHDSSGQWSQAAYDEIASFQSQGMSYAEAEKALISKNLSAPDKVIDLIVKKNKALWWGHDLYFAMIDQKASCLETYELLFAVSKTFLLMAMLLALCSYFGQLKRKEASSRAVVVSSVFLLIFLVVYQVIEVQPRYIYICYPFLSIVAADGAYRIERHVREMRACCLSAIAQKRSDHC